MIHSYLGSYLNEQAINRCSFVGSSLTCSNMCCMTLLEKWFPNVRKSLELPFSTHKDWKWYKHFISKWLWFFRFSNLFLKSLEGSCMHILYRNLTPFLHKESTDTLMFDYSMYPTYVHIVYTTRCYNWSTPSLSVLYEIKICKLIWRRFTYCNCIIFSFLLGWMQLC